MSWNFEELKLTAQNEADNISNEKFLEAYRIKYLGKKGIISDIYASLANASIEDKPIIGKSANDLKVRISSIIEEKKNALNKGQVSSSRVSLDVTIPGISNKKGHKHILTQTLDEICSLFEKMGFVVQEGPEIENEFNNFEALNIPPDHPSRDGFDTFYVDVRDPDEKDKYLLLRSHTSPGQSRIMKKYKPPLAVVIPGKVYRPDAVDASHSFMFHQVEGLLVDKNVKLSDLKGLLNVFCKKFFGDDIRMRFRPHFFPFTEPSAEVDISCHVCGGTGCSVCGKKGWIEIMGCGMVHPRVFEAVGYPKDAYTGLAFGLGIERMAMLRYGIKDIRMFFENDNRFLEQF